MKISIKSLRLVAAVAALLGTQAAALPAMASTASALGLPLSPTRITSPFGMRIHPITQESDFHTGLDLAAELNQQVHNVSPGVVVQAGARGLLGNAVEVSDAASGISTIYGHMNSVAVSVGQNVVRGQTLGYAGSTGRSTGVHVHFTVKRNGAVVDPLPFLRGIAHGGTLIAGDAFSGDTGRSAAPKLSAKQLAQAAQKKLALDREAALAAKKELASAQAAVAVAQKDADQYNYLFNEGAVSRRDAEIRQAALQAALDRVAQAQKKAGASA